MDLNDIAKSLDANFYKAFKNKKFNELIAVRWAAFKTVDRDLDFDEGFSIFEEFNNAGKFAADFTLNEYFKLAVFIESLITYYVHEYFDGLDKDDTCFVALKGADSNAYKNELIKAEQYVADKIRSNASLTTTDKQCTDVTHELIDSYDYDYCWYNWEHDKIDVDGMSIEIGIKYFVISAKLKIPFIPVMTYNIAASRKVCASDVKNIINKLAP
jgi:hypothetical protein